MDEHERISAKMSKFRPSLTLALKALVQERQSQGLPVYDFGLGETKGELDAAIRDAGIEAFRSGQTMYADPAGIPELRAAVLRWLRLEDGYTPANVVVSAGAKQSLFNIFLALCNPADCVLLDSAPWVSYQPLATAAYAFPVMVLPQSPRDHSLKITPDDLIRNLEQRPYTKLFLVNSPCNPTAEIYSASELTALLDVCADRGVFFVLDRLYWRIMFDGAAYPEPATNDTTRRWLIQVDGLSKNFRRTGGLRIGWCVAPDDVAEAMINVQSHYTSGPAVPTQHAALAAIDHAYDSELVDDLQRKRDLLHAAAAELPHVDIWPTPGSFYSFWDVRECIGLRAPDGAVLRNSDDVAAYLMRSAGVVTTSGSAFMQDGYLRVSFATSDKDIVEGMASARRVLASLQAPATGVAAAG